jgi:hypothetical protein
VSDPKYGDIRPSRACFLCGGPRYEEFTYENVYHNDTQDVWRPQHHDCVVELAKRIADIESRLAMSGATPRRPKK